MLYEQLHTGNNFQKGLKAKVSVSLLLTGPFKFKFSNGLRKGSTMLVMASNLIHLIVSLLKVVLIMFVGFSIGLFIIGPYLAKSNVILTVAVKYHVNLDHCYATL